MTKRREEGKKEGKQKDKQLNNESWRERQFAGETIRGKKKVKHEEGEQMKHCSDEKRPNSNQTVQK